MYGGGGKKNWKKCVMRIFMISNLHRYCSGYQIELDEVGRACDVQGVRRNTYRVLVGKPGGKKPLGKPKGRLKDNNRSDLYITYSIA